VPRFLVSSVLLSSIAMSSCQRGLVIREEYVRGEEGMTIPGPFSTARMRIHPLTHAERVEGTLRLVLHMELNDGWGDTIKALGTVKATIEPVGSGAGRAVTWDVDIRDSATNVSYFDSVTRTYRFVLTGVPAWFEQEGRGTLRVQFRTARADGTVNAISDRFEVEIAQSDQS
jgi:hypothetical protein